MKDAVEGSLGETKDRVGNSDRPRVGLSVSHACFHWTLCMVDISGTHGGSRWTRTWDTKDAQCSVYFCEI